MPIEIKELQIKAAIGSSPSNTNSQPYSPGDLARIKQEIVKEVTEEVLKSIQLKLER